MSRLIAGGFAFRLLAWHQEEHYVQKPVRRTLRKCEKKQWQVHLLDGVSKAKNKFVEKCPTSEY